MEPTTFETTEVELQRHIQAAASRAISEVTQHLLLARGRLSPDQLQEVVAGHIAQSLADALRRPEPRKKALIGFAYPN